LSKDYTNYRGIVTFHGGTCSPPYNGTVYPSMRALRDAISSFVGTGWSSTPNRLVARGDHIEVRRGSFDACNPYAILFIVRDECGVAIPAHFIEAHFQRLGREDSAAYWKRWAARRFPGGEAVGFRRGPVPGIRKRNWRGLPRLPRLVREVAENESILYDEDCAENGVVCRAARNRGMLMDTCWDEWDRARKGRSWKAHRATQWKG